METLSVKPERKAQLEAYAERHGQDTETALDDVLADYFAWEKQDYDDTVEAVLEGYEDVKAGRFKPADEVHNDQRRQNLKAWAQSHAGNTVVLADEDMERESIYGDRGN